MILTVQFTPGADPATEDTTAIVTKVHDGDTPTAGDRGNVRMLGIDAPELNQEPWGKTARAWLIAQIMGKQVHLLRDRHAGDHDKYGRLLRYVKLDGDKYPLNVHIVEAGLAVAYLDKRLEFGPEIELSQSFSKDGKKGIWGDPKFILPSEWRKGKR